MVYIIKLLELTGTVIGHGDSRDVRNKYVGWYDPDGNDGRGDLYYFDEPRHARRFKSMEDAYAFYHQTSTVRPLREDGEPNRPLTAFTVVVEPFDPDEEGQHADDHRHPGTAH